MKKKSKFSFLLIIILLVAGFLAYQYYAQKSIVTVTNNDEPQKIEKTESQMDKAIKSIQEREEFKKQQELRAKEIYLTEEKARIEAEYEAKLDSIEKQLESVRAEKVSFQ